MYNNDKVEITLNLQTNTQLKNYTMKNQFSDADSHAILCSLHGGNDFYSFLCIFLELLYGAKSTN